MQILLVPARDVRVEDTILTKGMVSRRHIVEWVHIRSGNVAIGYDKDQEVLYDPDEEVPLVLRKGEPFVSHGGDFPHDHTECEKD